MDASGPVDQGRRGRLADRRFANFLLQPSVQLKIGFVTTGFSLFAVILFGVYARHKLVEFSDVAATLTQADQAIKSLLSSYIRSLGITALVAAVVFVSANLTISIYFTHKLVGPTIAFRRHIRALTDGNFAAKTQLRSGDAFVEVAQDLNRLSEVLQEKSGGKRSP